jgi:hypothetical protein
MTHLDQMRLLFARQDYLSCEDLNGADGISDIEGKAARVAASELGSERVSNEWE